MSCLNKHHILEVENLSISFSQYERGLNQIELPIITDLNVSVHEGEIVAIIGASGSGKSLLAHAILGLLPYNATLSGKMYFDEKELTKERKELLRGKEIAFVPQSTKYLDPLIKVGKQVRGMDRFKQSQVIALQKKLFEEYGLEESIEDLYPFECSGGMERRILFLSALIGNPRLIIADEPTPGMDLELAKKTMKAFRKFADEGNGVLLITHDIELALEVADRIVIFYAGTTIEEALTSDFQSEELLRHPYTKAIYRALPQNGFQPLLGSQPYVKDMPKGCPFGPRCEMFSKECQGDIPIKLVRCGRVKCAKIEGEAGGHPH